jgi:hypothetical protein
MISILDKILTMEHRQKGLTLAFDDHLVYLIKNGQVIAAWSAQGATLEGIRKEADRTLGGDAVRELCAMGGINFKR